MNVIKATFRIVTPMFIAGADQSKAKLRAPSIKGALRFWWRALAYSRFDGDLAKIHKQEAELFGSTKRVATVQLKLPPYRLASHEVGEIHTDFVTTNSGQSGNDRPGARYLGYGLMSAFGANAGRLDRPCFDHGNTFDVTFISKEQIPEDFIDSIRVFGLLGGLGSRMRRGFGCIALNLLVDDKGKSLFHRPDTPAEYAEMIMSLLENSAKESRIPDYSAFTANTRIDYLGSADDPVEVLDMVGRQMQCYRSWGHMGQVNGELSEQNFPDDHKWCKGEHMPLNFHHPERVIFGLPQNYTNQRRNEVKPNDENVGRRASPLFLHIHKVSDEYIALATIIRARYLPEKLNDDGNHVEIDAAGRKVPDATQWATLDNFLEGRIGHRDNKSEESYFPERETWFGGPAS